MKIVLKRIFMLFRHPVIFCLSKCSSVVGLRSNISKARNVTWGENLHLGHDVRINFFGPQESRLTFGKEDYICNRVSFIVGDNIVLGNNVLVASDVCFVSENHGMDPLDNRSYALQPLNFRPIYIHDGVWIGEKAIILPGVEIGEKSIIAAGSVVTKSIPEYCIAGGNPARIIKRYNHEERRWDKVNCQE